MKKFLIVLVLICFSSCKEKRTEFIESKAIKRLVLVKNAPKSPDETKKIIIEYIKNQNNKDFIEFYEYSSNTKAFIEKERVGGYFREYIEHYQEEDGILTFYTTNCKNDTLKKVGIIRYYEKYGNFYEPDTIIGKCK